FLLAFAVALPWKYLGSYMPLPVLQIFQMTFHVSVFLGVFNLLPFPPLDGSKIIGIFIPRAWVPKYERFLSEGVRYFVAIILFDVFILGGVFGFSIFGFVLGFLHEWVSMVILLGT
ncbi:site-2 protease family protein, partial [Patescibacteria group bacterium]|nr:site-2 protease family protein [Patescibacteria group bacterium]